MENREFQVYVAVRPGTKEFLEEMSKYYELVIFTASLSKYAKGPKIIKVVTILQDISATIVVKFQAK